MPISVIDRGFISDVMVSVLSSSVVDHGFISDVMVSVLSSSVVDRGFISDVMVSDHYITDEPTIYHTRGEHANHYITDAVPTSYKK
jgi:hypothetical protein